MGRQLVVDYSTAGTYPYEVVGVVGDVRFQGPRGTPRSEVYLAHAQRPYLILNAVVKTAGDTRALAPAVRAAISGLDPQKPAQGIERLVDLLGATYARNRLVASGLLAFGGAAAFLALLGVYGVLTQRVRERTREIGLRLAMGAARADVVRWMGRSTAGLLGGGLVAGAAGAAAAARALDGWLFGVAATDALTVILVLGTLAAAGGVIAVVSSWRAMRIDPVIVLRHE